MDDLSAYLDSTHSSVQIDLRNAQWHLHGGIPNKPGWYHISTNAPVSVLQQQALWSSTYVRAEDRKEAGVKNYDLRARANRFSEGLSSYFNSRGVYSGLASNLLSRAREHTFADPGTRGLALAQYPALYDYEWVFHFVTLHRFMTDCQCEKVLLALGEQMWRAKHGWPLLCAG
jgi:hypothetical protein